MHTMRTTSSQRSTRPELAKEPAAARPVSPPPVVVAGVPSGVYARAVLADAQRRRLHGDHGIVAMALEEARAMDVDFYFSWRETENGITREVEGCSFDGARMLERLWGNCGTTVEDAEDETHWRFVATFHDSESGVRMSRIYRQPKGDPRGDDAAYQMGQSKAIRNVICDAMPSWLVRDCLAVARAAADLKFGAAKDQWAKMVEALKRHGVTEGQVRARLGLADGLVPTPRDVGTLNAIGRAIQAGQTSVEYEFLGTSPPSAFERIGVAPSKGKKDTTAGGAPARKDP